MSTQGQTGRVVAVLMLEEYWYAVMREDLRIIWRCYEVPTYLYCSREAPAVQCESRASHCSEGIELAVAPHGSDPTR